MKQEADSASSANISDRSLSNHLQPAHTSNSRATDKQTPLKQRLDSNHRPSLYVCPKPSLTYVHSLADIVFRFSSASAAAVFASVPF
jgi:hypothetical protein